MANIGNSIHERLPHSSEEVKQRLRSWNKSLGKRCRGKSKKGTDDIVLISNSAEKLKAAERETLRLESNLIDARRAVAENAKVTRELRALRGFDAPVSSFAASTSKQESVRSHPAVHSRYTTTKTNPAKECEKEVFVNLRGPLPPSHAAAAFDNDKDVQTSSLLSEESHTTHGTDRKYTFRFQDTQPYQHEDSTPNLQRSTSVSDLAGHVRHTFERFKRSASNVNLRKNFIRSDPHEKCTSAETTTIDPFRHSAPPSSLPSASQRSDMTRNILRPAQYSVSREPFLGSIAEHAESQRPRVTSFRRDMIFALHDTRVCLPQDPPIVVDRLNIGSVAERHHSPARSEEPRRPSHGSGRALDHLHRGPSSTAFQLIDQVNRASDMNALRRSINDSRALQGRPPLEFHQSLCAEAGIVATMYDVVNASSRRKRRSWATEIQFQESSSTTLELVGPPDVGGRVTGKMWADGEYSRQTQSRHADFSFRDHEGCQCHNFTIWEAITDARWRAIGLCRTEEEKRWVVVLSE